MKKTLAIVFAIGLFSLPALAQVNKINPTAMIVTPTGETADTLANLLAIDDETIIRGASGMATSNPLPRSATGTTDTVLATDAGRIVNYGNASDVAVTLPAATATGFTAGFGFSANNAGTSGTVTITPTTSTINGAATLDIPAGKGCYIYTSGTNYNLDQSTCTALLAGTKSIDFTTDGGGSAITTGVKGYFRVPYAGTIVGYSLLGDLSGNAVVDIWKDDGEIPTVADTITASAKPTLSSAQYKYSTTLTGWTTTVAEGDVFGFNVDSAATITRLTLVVYIAE
jgi:hypothetical protein